MSNLRFNHKTLAHKNGKGWSRWKWLREEKKPKRLMLRLEKWK